MQADRIGCVLAAFVALTGYAVDRYGYMAFFDFQALNAIQLQIFIDLSIALTFVMVWMWGDAKARGISPIPYVVITPAARQHRPAGLLDSAVRRAARAPDRRRSDLRTRRG